MHILFLSDSSVFEPQPLDLFSLTKHFGMDGAKKLTAVIPGENLIRMQIMTDEDPLF